MKKIILGFTILVFTAILSAQPYTNQIFKKEIKTVQLNRLGSELSEPILNITSHETMDRLKLSFDELGSDAKTYHYKFIHCNADWQRSQLHENEFLRGFSINQITDYSFSFNTSYQYVHYTLIFPNEDVQLLRSGNYIIYVYEDFNDQVPILARRFRITEQLVKIQPVVKFPINNAVRNKMQQVNISIFHPELNIVNPSQEVKVYVQQNGRQDNLAAKIPTVFIRPGELAYEYQNELLFEGGHEYHWLDIRSTRFLAQMVKTTNMHYPYYHSDLFPDMARNGTPYFYREDHNGKYVVSVREFDNPDVDADYIFVHLFLPMSAPILDGDIYVLGGLTDWDLQPSNKMTYNFNSMQYEATLLLKQGFYNYQYLFVPKNETKGSLETIEGSHSITENDYQIFVYYRGRSDYYDRLVGAELTNSLKPQKP